MTIIEYSISLIETDLPLKKAYKESNDKFSLPDYLSLTIFTPIMEELLYRLGLKFSVKNTSFFIIGILYTFYLFFQPKEINFNNPNTLILFWFGFFATLFIVYFIVKIKYISIKEFYNINPRFIFIISVIIFAFSHYSLYETSNVLKNILYSPIYLMPYFLAGFIYGVIRLKLGFIWCCLAHIFWNSFVTFI